MAGRAETLPTVRDFWLCLREEEIPNAWMSLFYDSTLRNNFNINLNLPLSVDIQRLSACPSLSFAYLVHLPLRWNPEVVDKVDKGRPENAE